LDVEISTQLTPQERTIVVSDLTNLINLPPAKIATSLHEEAFEGPSVGSTYFRNIQPHLKKIGKPLSTCKRAARANAFQKTIRFSPAYFSRSQIDRQSIILHEIRHIQKKKAHSLCALNNVNKAEHELEKISYHRLGTYDTDERVLACDKETLGPFGVQFIFLVHRLKNRHETSLAELLFNAPSHYLTQAPFYIKSVPSRRHLSTDLFGPEKPLDFNDAVGMMDFNGARQFERPSNDQLSSFAISNIMRSCEFKLVLSMYEYPPLQVEKVAVRAQSKNSGSWVCRMRRDDLSSFRRLVTDFGFNPDARASHSKRSVIFEILNHWSVEDIPPFIKEFSIDLDTPDAHGLKPLDFLRTRPGGRDKALQIEALLERGN